MNFAQYLDDYMTIKRLRGVTPGQRESTALFAPYFNKQAAGEAEGRRMNLAEREQGFKEKQAGEGLAWNREKAISDLALQKWQNEELMKQASRQDTKATIGNVISSAAPLGNLYYYKKYGYLK